MLNAVYTHRPILRGLMAALMTLAAPAAATADLQVFENDEAGWQNAVGPFDTIDFTKVPKGTIVTDQYADLGVHFTDGTSFIHHNMSYLDGAGLHSSHIDQETIIEFDKPQKWIAAHHPSDLSFDLYLDGNEIASHDFTNVGSDIFFSGVISEDVFDSIRFHRAFSNTPAFIDNLYFGVPSPGVTAIFALTGLLGGSRRRSD